jgi:hypothetical protein
MNRGADKVLAALACAILLGAMGAFSWHDGHEECIPNRGIYDGTRGLEKSDEVVRELERIQTFWRSNDAGTTGGKSSAGNP